jgi:hypothetical protein
MNLQIHRKAPTSDCNGDFDDEDLGQKFLEDL